MTSQKPTGSNSPSLKSLDGGANSKPSSSSGSGESITLESRFAGYLGDLFNFEMHRSLPGDGESSQTERVPVRISSLASLRLTTLPGIDSSDAQTKQNAGAGPKLIRGGA